MTGPEPRKRRAPLPGPLGRLGARLYLAAITRRNRRFDQGHGVTRLPLPVISVGNLSVGGTGKTPMVMHLLATLAASGHRPCIAMRGYRAGREGSDEAAEYARAFPAVPVVAQPDRLAGLQSLLASERGHAVDCIVLDDGFQHRRIARDLDIVLLDATRSPFEDRLLPAGWLREPVESLNRAHVAMVTHAEAVAPDMTAELLKRALAINPALKTAIASHRWARLQSAERAIDTASLSGRPYLLACAIGNPGPFIQTAREALGPPADVLLRPDHDPYRPATVRGLISHARACKAEFILTTEKDWSKLARVPTSDWPCPVVRPSLAMTLESGQAELERAVHAALRGDRPAAARPRV
jgi:tetraacyldisaccharide 4'-kinase